MKRLLIPLCCLLLLGACGSEDPAAPAPPQDEQRPDPTPGPEPEPEPEDPGPVTGTMTDPRDGIVYETVQLGSQVWMAENLRYLPGQHAELSDSEPRYYVMFDNDARTELGAEFLRAYGAFYNLPAALQGEKALTETEARTVRGICPEGWHLPARREWQQLADYVLEAGMAAPLDDGTVDPTALAKALASVDMWLLPEFTEIEEQPTWPAVYPERNNASRFNGKPVGFRACAGDETWMHACYSAGWWSATQGTLMGPEFGVPVRMWSDLHTFVTSSEFHPAVGLPVRCLKD